MKLIGKYKFFIGVLTCLIGLFFIDYEAGIKATEVTAYSLKEMILVIPPIFILLGLLDIWVPKATMVEYMGENSGVRGKLLSLLIGSSAAGPLYGAFPVAVVFMKKGVRFSNIIIFLGAWSTTKLPMFLFEMSSLGKKFAVSRLVINILGIFIISWIISNLISKEEIEKIYLKVEKL